MFDKKHLDKVLKLNAEHATASPERRKQIEQEIISLVPANLKSNTTEIKEMSELQERLKNKIEQLAQCATKADFDLYFRELDQIDLQIHEYAKKLGVNFPRNNYDSIKQRMIEIRFNETK